MVNFENGVTPINDENLNKMQQDIGTIVSPIEPQGNEKLKVWIQKGKNLISIEELSNNAINESNGLIESNKTRMCSNFIYLFKGTYSISCNLSRFAYAIYDEKKQFNKFVSWNSFPAQIIIEKNCFVIIEFIKNPDGSVEISKNDISTLQLEQNSEVTEYEEYIEPKMYVLNNNNVYEEFIKKATEFKYVDRGSSIDFNTFTKNGFYQCNFQNGINAPDTFSTGMLLVFGDFYIAQLYIADLNSKAKVFARMSANQGASWNSWVTLA